MMELKRCDRCNTYFVPEYWQGGYCKPCNDILWKQWEVDEAHNLDEIKNLQNQGHPQHCACRQVWGDGECECDLYAKGYDPYAWLKIGIK
jgi:hypothetical protein